MLQDELENKNIVDTIDLGSPFNYDDQQEIQALRDAPLEQEAIDKMIEHLSQEDLKEYGQLKQVNAMQQINMLKQKNPGEIDVQDVQVKVGGAFQSTISRNGEVVAIA